MADQDATDREIASYNQRAADDHGVPAVLRGLPDDRGRQERATLVRITEPGNYYLHLVQAADGRVWAGFTSTASSYEVASDEEVTGRG